MKICQTCGIEKELKDFPASKKATGRLYYRPHCYSCKYDKEVLSGRKQDKEYMKSYYFKNKLDFKYKAYRHSDKVKGFTTVDRYVAIELMMKPCFYCGTENSNGLDRKDSGKGHSEDNVVPCCEKCNNILGDLPYEAKLCLGEGLTIINNKGLLKEWTIPTKRKERKKPRGLPSATSSTSEHTAVG